MANNWNIPAWLESEIRQRDTHCIYCGVKFTSAKISKKSAASWEHIINDESIISKENIALCCCSCNASKGQKRLSVWLQTPYCKKFGITPETIAPIAQLAFQNNE